MLISTNSRIVDARQEAFYVTKGDINKKLVFATFGATPTSYYEAIRVSADRLKEMELNRLTSEVLARLPQARIIDKVTVVRACQHLAFVAYPENPTYLGKLWDQILELADLVERAGQLLLATELRSLVEGWRTP